jgi:hypothetical protein
MDVGHKANSSLLDVDVNKTEPFVFVLPRNTERKEVDRKKGCVLQSFRKEEKNHELNKRSDRRQ